MFDDYLSRHLARGNRNLLLTGLLLLVGVAALFGLHARYWYNFRHGPFALADSDLARMTDPLAQTNKRWVTFECKRVPVAIGTSRVEGQKASTQYYHYVPLGFRLHRVLSPAPKGAKPDTRPATEAEIAAAKAYFGKHNKLPEDILPEATKAVLLRVPREVKEPGRFTGELRAITREERTKLELDQVTELLPVLISVDNYRLGGYLGLGFGALFVLIGLGCVVTALGRIGSRERHWTCRLLSRYGRAEDLATSLMVEVGSDGTRREIGPNVVTSRWVARPRFTGLDVMPLDDVLWAYEKVVQRRVNFVPAGKEFAAVLADRTGRLLELGGKQSQVEELLAEVFGRRPWILPGYSDELDVMYRRQRDELARIVDQRRAELERRPGDRVETPSQDG
ncbi:MAG: hypothetical protein HZB16_24110 [Armatimonadetes bacterium]|nr:hypothetical protein [Armatimonadota bacterium]